MHLDPAGVIITILILLFLAAVIGWVTISVNRTLFPEGFVQYRSSGLGVKVVVWFSAGLGIVAGLALAAYLVTHQSGR